MTTRWSNLMALVRDVADDDDFRFVDPARRQAARRAFDAGIACILKCQVSVDGTLTVWCAQHDEITLEPRPARTFEPVSLSGAESADILVLLMSLERPGPEVIRSIQGGRPLVREVPADRNSRNQGRWRQTDRTRCRRVPALGAIL